MGEFKAALDSDDTRSSIEDVQTSHLVLALLSLSRGDTSVDYFPRETLADALRVLFDSDETIATIYETLLGVLFHAYARFMQLRGLASRTPLRLCFVLRTDLEEMRRHARHELSLSVGPPAIPSPLVRDLRLRRL